MPRPPMTEPRILAPRLTPQKTPPGELAVWLLIRWSLTRMFARVRLRQVGADPRAAGVPLLGVATHPSWWDGYLALAMSRHYRLSRYLMMDEAQLRRYGFFRWLGCFSVDRADARESARSVAYAAHLLATERQPLVWLFPQAEITPADRRPIEAHGGAAHVLRRATAGGKTVGWLPVAWRYEFRGEQHPEAFIRVGAVEIVAAAEVRDTRALTARISAALTREADALRDDLAADDVQAYGVILRGAGGINDRWDGVLRRRRLVAEPGEPLPPTPSPTGSGGAHAGASRLLGRPGTRRSSPPPPSGGGGRGEEPC